MDTSLIDTSIILEPFTRFKKDMKSYKNAALALIRYPQSKNFKPAISMSILGELECILNEKENLIRELSDNREKMKEILNSFFSNCEIIGLKRETIHLAHDILREDSRLDPLDIIHFSSAIVGGCKSFIFMDRKLRESEVIKRIAKRNNFNLIPFNIKENEDKGRIDRNLTWLQ